MADANRFRASVPVTLELEIVSTMPATATFAALGNAFTDVDPERRPLVLANVAVPRRPGETGAVIARVIAVELTPAPWNRLTLRAEE